MLETIESRWPELEVDVHAGGQPHYRLLHLRGVGTRVGRAYGANVDAAIRVALVEDNDVFREALELLLGLQPEIEIVAALPDGHDVVEMCRELAAGRGGHGLPDAGARRRPGDGRDRGGVPEHGRDRADRLRERPRARAP